MGVPPPAAFLSRLNWMLDLVLAMTPSSSINSERRLQENYADNIFAAAPRDNAFIELAFEDRFVDDCSSFLLSKASVQDERISQVEYAEFIGAVCVEEGFCKEGGQLSYESINDNLQTLFLDISCPESSEEGQAACFYDFKRMGSEYGFVADPRTIQVIDGRIATLCSASYRVINREGIFGGKTSSGVDDDEKARPEPEPQGPPPTTTPTNAPTRAQAATTNKPAASTTTASLTTDDSRTQSPTDVTADESPQKSQEATGTEDDGSYNLTFGAIASIIGLIVVIFFCGGVIYSGRTKHVDYDINQAQPIEGLRSVDNTRNIIFDGNNVFRDEEDFGSYRDG